jgi:hypothetical protein
MPTIYQAIRYKIVRDTQGCQAKKELPVFWQKDTKWDYFFIKSIIMVNCFSKSP